MSIQNKTSKLNEKKATNTRIENVYKIIHNSDKLLKNETLTTIKDKFMIYICQNLPENYKPLA